MDKHKELDMKTTNTMSGMLNHIQHMVRNGIIDLDDFYDVSYNVHMITLQGRYSSDKLSDYTRLWSFHINGCNGFIEGKEEIDGVVVKILFT